MPVELAPPGASGRSASITVAVVIALAAVVIMWMGRGVALIGDQWAWIFAAVDPHLRDAFQNYNGHLVATTFGLYDLLPRISLTQFWLYRVVALVLHLAVAYLVFCLARQRIGAWAAVAPAVIVAFLGTGADAYLSGLNYNAVAATGACLGALLAFERRTSRADLAASGLLLVGLASFSNAVAFAAGVFVEALWQRDRRRRVWVAVLPLALYAAWRLHWGSSSDAAPGGAFDVARHSFRAATGAFAGLAGVQLENFTLKAHLPWLSAAAQVVFAFLVLVTCAVFGLRRIRIGPRLANLLVSGIVLWLLIAFARGSSQNVYASRYVYQGAVIALLIVVEVASAFDMRGRTARRLLILAVAVSVVLNVGWMAVWARHMRHVTTVTRGQLAALEIARDAAPPSFAPSPGFLLGQVTARDYYAAVGTFGGSPAYTTAQLRQASEEVRRAADRVLVRAFSLRFARGGSPAHGVPPPEVEHVTSARVLRHGSCLTLSPMGTAPVVELAVRSPSGIVLRRTPRGTLVGPGAPFRRSVRDCELRGTAAVAASRGWTRPSGPSATPGTCRWRRRRKPRSAQEPGAPEEELGTGSPPVPNSVSRPRLSRRPRRRTVSFRARHVPYKLSVSATTKGPGNRPFSFLAMTPGRAVGPPKAASWFSRTGSRRRDSRLRRPR